MTAPLELSLIEAGYGAARVLFGVDLAVASGEVVCLLGPNGAGKTTVARVASGLVAPTAGRVLVGGVDMTGAPAHEIATAGAAHVVQGRSVFSSLTVAENIRLGLEAAGAEGDLDKAWDLFPMLADRRDDAAGNLSGGEQRVLSLVRVLLAPPEVLILDEPSFGLAPIIVNEVFAVLARVAAQGTAMLVIEQQPRHALELASRAVVMGHGVVEWSGEPAALHGSVELIATGGWVPPQA